LEMALSAGCSADPNSWNKMLSEVVRTAPAFFNR